MKRVATNLFVSVLLFLFVADAIPSYSAFQDRLKAWIDPALDVTGLWQGEWALFAPAVIKRNVRMSAEIGCSNGKILVWKSPALHKLSVPERFLAFREGEYFDSIRNDSEAGAWEGLADYLVRTEIASQAPGERAGWVRLLRHWRDVPPPGTGVVEAEEITYEIYRKIYER